MSCTTPNPSDPITEGYTAGISIALGLKYTNILNLIYCQLVNHLGVNQRGPILSGFIEIGNGMYYLKTLIPNGFRGGLKIQYCGITLGFIAINPEDYENLDVKVSTRCSSTGIGVPSITNPIPINPESPIELRLTDDYLVAESRSIDITSVYWPDLTGSTTQFMIDSRPSFIKTATLLNQTSLRVELTNQELATIGCGRWSYEFRCTLANGHKITLALGNIVIVPPFGD
jgi:hypothetical protein